MGNLKFSLIAVASLALAACQPTGAPNGGATSTPTPGVDDPASCGLAANTLVDEKALYGAEVAYNVPAHAYVTLDGSGKLTPELKARVKPLLVDAYNYLVLARSAYAIGDVCEFFGAVERAKDLANKAKAILPN